MGRSDMPSSKTDVSIRSPAFSDSSYDDVTFIMKIMLDMLCSVLESPF